MNARGTAVILCALGIALVASTASAEDVSLADPGHWTAKAPETFRARFDCSNGSFVVEVTRSLSPRGADRFYNLVRSGFFDGARFFRVRPGFVVQFGLNGLPEVDQAWFRARIQDDQVQGSNTLGTLSFATAGANSRTTQVFINLGDNTGLDAQGFSPFGRIVEGLDVVTAINPEYGEQPSQGLIRDRGNAYLQEDFPELDFILKATVVGEARREAPAQR